VVALVLALTLGALLAGCGGGSSSSLAPNQMRMVVGPNPDVEAVDPGASGRDIPFVSVVVCDASNRCVKVPHVMVDSGSVGLRLRAKPLAGLHLQPLPFASDAQLDECTPFLTGVMWGSVEQATVELGGEPPIQLPIEVFGGGSPAPTTMPTICADFGSNASNLLGFKANGILGIQGLEKIGNLYYACRGSACTIEPTASVPAAELIVNPVSKFDDSDDNGVILTLPSVPANGLPSAQGTLTFGLDTQDDNRTTGFVPLATDGNFSMNVVVQGVAYSSSTIDSGSNGIFGPFSLPYDSATTSFDPTTPQVVPITLENQTGTLPAVSVSSSITIANSQVLADPSSYALDDYGAYSSTSNQILLGLPYFFGRSVAFAMSGKTSGLGTGPIIGVLNP
jgi:hypothetical protein